MPLLLERYRFEGDSGVVELQQMTDGTWSVRLEECGEAEQKIFEGDWESAIAVYRGQKARVR